MRKQLIPALLASSLLFLLPGCDSGGGGGKKNNTGDPGRIVDGGRIPTCTDDTGIDLYAVEGDTVIALSWNNNTGQTFNNYRINYGHVDGNLDQSTTAPCTTTTCEATVTELTNDTQYGFVVHALDGNGKVAHTSCGVAATPHVLAFQPDVLVHGDDSVQNTPAITGADMGAPLYMAWESGGSVFWSRSDDLGDTWSQGAALTEAGTSASTPALAFLDRSAEETPASSWLYVVSANGGNVELVRGELSTLDSTAAFSAATSIGAGTNPSIGVVPGLIVIAYENNNQIMVARSTNNGESFSTPLHVDKAAAVDDVSNLPSVSINSETLAVHVGYQARRGSGDYNVYLISSADQGQTFADTEVRIDDDTGGGNQTSISIAVDGRTGLISATWEDKRQGTSVYYADSTDGGTTFSSNVQTGAGLNGDQTEPMAVIDRARNVYVLFIDSTNGQKPLFSRFNATGSFDPPLTVSTQAGSGGAAAKAPAVFVDLFGTVYTTWAENRQGSDTDIYFARAE